MKLAVLALGVLVASSGCGETVPASSAADPAAKAPSNGGQRSAPLLFEAKKAGAKPFPFPFVEVKIGETTTRFLVDTGAAVHAIDSEALKAAQLAAPPHAASIEIPGWGPLVDHAVTVVELPASIRAHGIGGILSPQLLAEAGKAVVLDLANAQLRLLPRSTAWSQIEDLGTRLTPPAHHFCAADSAGVPGLLIALDGAVDGEATKLAIDTGASRTLVREGSRGGARVATHPVLGRSIALSSMADLPASIHGGVPLVVGGLSQTADIGLTPGAPHPQCGYEGRIGMDVLRLCAVAMTADEVLVACRPSAR